MRRTETSGNQYSFIKNNNTSRRLPRLKLVSAMYVQLFMDGLELFNQRAERNFDGIIFDQKMKIIIISRSRGGII